MKKIVSLLLALVMVLSLAACGSKTETTTTAKPAGTTTAKPAGTTASGQPGTTTTAAAPVEYQEHLTVGVDVKIASYDPTSNTMPVFNRLVFNELIRYNKETAQLEEALATSWKWVDDTATKLHIELRKDVKFSNGNPFTAADVEFTLGYNKNANIAGYYDHCEIKDDYSLDIVLKSGNADFVYMLTNILYACMLDKESCEADPTNGPAIGTGAWIVDVEKSIPGDTIELTRNENYWGEKPETKQLTLKYIKDASSRLIALQNKEIVAMMTVGETDVDTVENDKNLSYMSGVGVGPAKMYYIAFNMKNGKCADNLNLRMAIACALNSAEIIAAYSDANAVEVPDRAFWGFDTPYRATQADFKYDLSYNVEQAKKLVEAAKAEMGEIPTLKLLSNYSKAVNSTMCLAVQAELKAIGINVEIIESDSAGVLKYTNNDEPGDFDMIQYNVPLESWASAAARMFVKGSNNRAIMDVAEINDLLAKGAASSDEKVREECYKAIQTYIHDEAIYIPIYYGSRDGAQLSGVEGVVWTNDGYPEFTYIRLAK